MNYQSILCRKEFGKKEKEYRKDISFLLKMFFLLKKVCVLIARGFFVDARENHVVACLVCQESVRKLTDNDALRAITQITSTKNT